MARLAATVFGMVLLAPCAIAGLIVEGITTNGTQVNAVGITGFTTLGSNMAGLAVSVFFTNGATSNCVWAITGPDSGGCSFAGQFTIAESGDTFTSNWVFRNTSTFLSVASLVLNGVPGNTAFDKTFGGLDGTPGSFSGATVTGTTTDNSQGLGNYSNIVAIMPAAAVGDSFGLLTINFSQALTPGATATFLADTDNIGMPGGTPGSGTPEPSTLAMLAIAGVAAYVLKRRSRAASARSMR